MALQCQEKKDITFTVIRSQRPFGKTIYLENNEIKAKYKWPSMGAECFTKTTDSLEEFMTYTAECQADKRHSYSFTYGITDYDKFKLAKKTEENIEKKQIARTKENFKFKGRGILFIDVDRIDLEPEELHKRLIEALPELKNVKFAWRPSSSSFLFNNKTNEYVRKNYGHRFYAVVENMEQVAKFSKNLITRLSVNQLNYKITTDSFGNHDVKCAFDDMGEPERLDQVTNPTVHAPLTKINKETIFFGGNGTITDYIVRKSAISTTILNKIKKVVIQKPKNKHTVTQLRAKHGKLNYEKLKNKILPDKHLLHLQTGETILAEDWEKHVNKQLCDPVDPTYNNDNRIAMIFDSGIIFSHAHGGISYRCPQRIVKPEVSNTEKSSSEQEDNTLIYNTNLQNSCQDIKKIFNEEDKQSLIIAPAGIGKTRAMIEYIAENPSMLIGIAVQNDRMAQQIAEDLKAHNIEPLVYKGLEKSCIKYSPEETSKMIDMLNKLHIHHNSFSRNICAKGQRGQEEYCEHFEQCPYQKQKTLARRKKVIIFCQQLLFIDSILTNTEKPIEFDVLFIDEDPLTSKALAKTIKADQPDINIAFNCIKNKKPISNIEILKKIVKKEKDILRQQYIFINDIIRPNVNILTVIKALQDFMNDFKVDKKLIKTIDTILDDSIKKYITNDLTTLEYMSPITLTVKYSKLIILDATPFVQLYKKVLPDIKIKQINCQDGNSPINIIIKANTKTNSDIYTMTTLKKEETINTILKVAETCQREWGGTLGVITTLEVSKRLSDMGLNALHYGCRGLNHFENIDVLILAGRIMPPENYLRQLANFVFDDEIDPADLKGLVKNTKLVRKQKISYYELKHPKLLSIANNFINQTVTQAKERMRTLRGNENRLCIFLGVPVIEDYDYNEVLTLDEFNQAIFKRCG